MIKCISYWSFEHGLAGTHPISDALQEAKDAGFDGLELCIGTDGALSTQSTQAECEAIRRAIEESGLIVQTVAAGLTWGANPVSNDPDVREQSVSLHEQALQRVAWLGCDAMLMVPGVVNSPIAPDQHVRNDHALSRCRENTARLLAAAERLSVDLCLENVWNGMFYSPLEFAQFIDDLNSDRLGIYLDVGNLLGYDQFPPHWIELLAHRIKRVHIKDFKHEFDWAGRYDFCRLLEGDVPFTQTMAALKAVGYDQTVVAEMLPWKPGLIEHTAQAMDQILGRVSSAS